MSTDNFQGINCKMIGIHGNIGIKVNKSCIVRFYECNVHLEHTVGGQNQSCSQNVYITILPTKTNSTTNVKFDKIKVNVFQNSEKTKIIEFPSIYLVTF